MQVYDKMNNAGSWSIGSRIDQMLENCGALCEDGGCTASLGDVNEDELLNIQDLITMVNHILDTSTLIDCALEAADMNVDGTINIQDLISLVNAILGTPRLEEFDGSAEVSYLISGNDLVIKINSDIDISGIQISLIDDSNMDIQLKDNSHINQESNFSKGVNRYIAYSIFNQAFDSHETEVLINSAAYIDIDSILLIVADLNGDALSLSHSTLGDTYQSGPYRFDLAELYPNPFNPSTQIAFSLAVDGFVRLSAYNVLGNEVDVIFQGFQGVGQHSYTWDATNLPSGVYYVKLQSGDLVSMQKALLIK